jgi:hypothetical protein
MKEYDVTYNGWIIPVLAESVKKARYQAFLKFKDVYPISFIEFMMGIDEVS